MSISSPQLKRIKLESPLVHEDTADHQYDDGPPTEGPEFEDHCSICLQPVVDRTVIPTCSHEFCFECLVMWAEQSRRCPLCSRALGEYLIHRIRSKYDYQKHYLPPLRSSPTPPQYTDDRQLDNTLRRNRRAFRERVWGRREQAEQEEADRLERAIAKRKWVYEHNLYAKHVASNAFTRYRPYPTPAQFAASQEYISRTTAFLRRELRVWPNLDVEFLTTFIISLMKAIDIRSESAVKLLAEFLDMDSPYVEGNRHVNAEHFAHEVYSYVRSPYKDLFVYDSVAQYDAPPELPPPPQHTRARRWRPSPSRSRSPLRKASLINDRRSYSCSPSWSPSGRNYSGLRGAKEKVFGPPDKQRSKDSHSLCVSHLQESSSSKQYSRPPSRSRDRSSSANGDLWQPRSMHYNEIYTPVKLQDGKGKGKAVDSDHSQLELHQEASAHHSSDPIIKHASNTIIVDPAIRGSCYVSERTDVVPSASATSRRDKNAPFIRQRRALRNRSLLESVQVHLASNLKKPVDTRVSALDQDKKETHVQRSMTSYSNILDRLSDVRSDADAGAVPSSVLGRSKTVATSAAESNPNSIPQSSGTHCGTWLPASGKMAMSGEPADITSDVSENPDGKRFPAPNIMARTRARLPKLNHASPTPDSPSGYSVDSVVQNERDPSPSNFDLTTPAHDIVGSCNAHLDGSAKNDPSACIEPSRLGSNENDERDKQSIVGSYLLNIAIRQQHSDGVIQSPTASMAHSTVVPSNLRMRLLAKLEEEKGQIKQINDILDTSTADSSTPLTRITSSMDRSLRYGRVTTPDSDFSARKSSNSPGDRSFNDQHDFRAMEMALRARVAAARKHDSGVVSSSEDPQPSPMTNGNIGFNKAPALNHEQALRMELVRRRS